MIILLKTLLFIWQALLCMQVVPAIIVPLWMLCTGARTAKPFGWCYFAAVQVVALDAAIIGWLLLIAPCAMRAWTPVEQIYQADWQRELGLPKKTIEIWSWAWLNRVWGNDEDGVVTGLCGNVEYNPEASRWGAYLWSAWRNSANNLRFVFRWKGGPFYRWENSAHTKYFQLGWYPNGFPVISGGAK
jgi:hypothetical protein